MINVDQEEALEVLESGLNTFLTGPAGAGKTHVIKSYAASTKKNVAITATTGIAALNIGGETIHRFLGLGILTRPEDATRIIAKWDKKKKSSKPWDKEAWATLSSLDVLVIDEVSMLRRDQFELIDAVLSNVLENPAPFGGIQIVLVGDFFQLPPVVTGEDRSRHRDMKNPYCFQSGLWHHGKFASVNLNTNYRQSNQEFLDVLNKIRVGHTDAQVDEMMKSRLNVTLDTEIRPVKLFPFKKEVARENMECLKALNKDVYVSEAEYKGKQFEVDILKKDCPADEKLYFCEGAQIMMLTNDPEGRWVNGSMGVIIDTDPVRIKLSTGTKVQPPVFTWERVVHKTKNKKIERKVVAELTQYPFKLAYATTIHKSQGLTLDYVDLDLSNCFASGQAYVALSRVRDIDGLVLRDWNTDVVKADEVIKKFYSLIEE